MKCNVDYTNKILWLCRKVFCFNVGLIEGGGLEDGGWWWWWGYSPLEDRTAETTDVLLTLPFHLKNKARSCHFYVKNNSDREDLKTHHP